MTPFHLEVSNPAYGTQYPGSSAARKGSAQGDGDHVSDPTRVPGGAASSLLPPPQRGDGGTGGPVVVPLLVYVQGADGADVRVPLLRLGDGGVTVTL